MSALLGRWTVFRTEVTSVGTCGFLPGFLPGPLPGCLPGPSPGLPGCSSPLGARSFGGFPSATGTAELASQTGWAQGRSPAKDAPRSANLEGAMDAASGSESSSGAPISVAQVLA